MGKIAGQERTGGEIMKANIRQEAEENTAQQILTATQSSAASDGNDAKQNVYYNPKPEQIALLIETKQTGGTLSKIPFVGSFQVETARTANEGLQNGKWVAAGSDSMTRCWMASRVLR